MVKKVNNPRNSSRKPKSSAAMKARRLSSESSERLQRSQGKRKMRGRILFPLIGLLTLAACSEGWEAVVYPDADDPSQSVRLGEYSSFEDCEGAALSYIDERGYTNADYGCGLNCEYNSEYDYSVCEKTAP